MWLREECVHDVCIVSTTGHCTTGGSVYLPESSPCHIMVYEAPRSLLPLLTRVLKALHYVCKPMLLFHGLFMGTKLTPLTLQTFLSRYPEIIPCPACRVAEDADINVFALRGV